MRFLILLLIPLTARASFFGEENIPLIKLVAGQLVELQHLAEAVNISKENMSLLLKINDGMDRVTRQIDSLNSIVDRAKGLDPRSVRQISDLTNAIYDLKNMKASVDEVLAFKILISDQAIAGAAIQSDTSYKMGQEMIGTGANLANESRNASPGRAAQITASAGSANMLAQGVMLQTLAHMSELQALSLELQKTNLERETNLEKGQRNFMASEITKRKALK